MAATPASGRRRVLALAMAPLAALQLTSLSGGSPAAAFAVASPPRAVGGGAAVGAAKAAKAGGASTGRAGAGAGSAAAAPLLLAGGAAALAAGRCSGRGARLCRRATEEKLVKELKGFPDNYDADDMDDVMKVLKKMPKADDSCYEQLVGDWKVEWSTLGGNAFPKKPKKPSNMKFLSFGALPAANVMIVGSYNRVSDTREGGTGDVSGVYDLVQVFELPDKPGVQAAMVLTGSWSCGAGASGEWGKGAERKRCGVQFETVRVVPSSEDTDASLDIIKEAGLAGAAEPVSLQAKATYIDIDYMSPAMRVHKGESGAIYALKRLGDGEVPFKLDG